jgi:hypothetical protein
LLVFACLNGAQGRELFAINTLKDVAGEFLQEQHLRIHVTGKPSRIIFAPFAIFKTS